MRSDFPAPVFCFGNLKNLAECAFFKDERGSQNQWIKFSVFKSEKARKQQMEIVKTEKTNNFYFLKMR